MPPKTTKKKTTKKKTALTKAQALPAKTFVDVIGDAVNQGATYETINQLMQFDRSTKEEDARLAFLKAKAEFNAECPVIETDHQTGEFRHATLGKMIQVLLPVMSKHGFIHRWQTNQSDQLITVKCILSHTDGHEESCVLSAPPDYSDGKNEAQAIASTTTYLERYTLFAVLGLAAYRDDDGQGSAPVRKPVTQCLSAEQIDLITDALDDHGIQISDFNQYLNKTFKTFRINEVPASAFDRIMKLILANSKAPRQQNNSNVVSGVPTSSGVEEVPVDF